MRTLWRTKLEFLFYLNIVDFMFLKIIFINGFYLGIHLCIMVISIGWLAWELCNFYDFMDE